MTLTAGAQNGFLTISHLSDLSGVPIFTIRAWEKRYRALSPKRTATERRVYSLIDVARLKKLKQAVDQGVAIRKVAGLSDSELDHLLDEGSSKIKVPSFLSSPELFFDLPKFELELNHYLRSENAVVLCERVTELMQAVGKQVLGGKLDIFHEHLVTALIQEAIQNAPQNFQSEKSSSEKGKSKKPRKILICTPEGDLHEIGILLAKWLCIHFGHEPIYLGPNLPVPSIVKAVQSFKPDRVLLVKTEHTAGVLMRSQFTEEVKTVLRRLETKQKLWLAGTATQSLDSKLKTDNRMEIFSRFEDLVSALHFR